MSQYPPNPEQKNIINHIEGAILVLAPVGTGKTRVLSDRVVKAIQSGIPAEKILCLTFTNRAAKEMKERLAQSCPDEVREITIKTFHGLCTSILRIEARNIGLPADFFVYDDADCIGLIKEIFNVSKDKNAQEIFFKLAECKSKTNQFDPQNRFISLGQKKAELATQYQIILQERHSLDFADLIFNVRLMLNFYPDLREKWEQRFDFIQVDEVQDTHLSEYEIVHSLANHSGNIAMIGDLDQTIYEWRGSEPDQVIGQFKQDFQPQEYSLVLNYRATQTLLNAASAFADCFTKRYTQITPAKSCQIGDSIELYTAKTENEEAKWIGKQIQKLANNDPNFDYNRIAVLTRNHKRIYLIASILEKLDIPCVTVEQYHFFMRQEVKDALAYLRLIINPFDTASMRRILLRPPRGIGDATINHLINEGQDYGLHLTDMIFKETFVDGDPFSHLLTAYYSGTIVVFDVETTGLSVSEDEVIEVAGVKLVEGQVTDEFNYYIANEVSVGDSQNVHHHSDDFLAEKGQPAIKVFREFLDFIQGALLVGHNVEFDIKMLTAHARRIGLNPPLFQWADTWNLSNRFIESDSYRLGVLAKNLNLSLPTHKAIDDARTTVELLLHLIPLIEQNSDERRAVVYRYGENFETLAQQLEHWRQKSQQIRPANLLEQILQESGLYAYYQQDEKKRLDNLQRLIKMFQEKDDLGLHPETALRYILEEIALAKDLDKVSQDNNQLLVITVHQAKGLEFDTVFLAGLCENEFPSYYSIRDRKIEEEKHLFYVAMTRAKKRLFLSTYLTNANGYTNQPSRFLMEV